MPNPSRQLTAPGYPFHSPPLSEWIATSGATRASFKSKSCGG